MTAGQGQAPAYDPTAVPTGNTTDKYGTSNPVIRLLVGRFTRDMEELLDLARPGSVLDVGCGEGVMTEQMADRLNGGRIVGIDLDDPKLREEWQGRRRPNLTYIAVPAEQMPFEEDEFEMASALEVLEHVHDPDLVLSQMARIARSHLLVSVPREPIWRMVNVARGSYLRDWGNTPGHLNHWSKPAFLDLVSKYGVPEEVRSPFPWTMVLVRLD